MWDDVTGAEGACRARSPDDSGLGLKENLAHRTPTNDFPVPCDNQTNIPRSDKDCTKATLCKSTLSYISECISLS